MTKILGRVPDFKREFALISRSRNFIKFSENFTVMS
jgi:hypothetical protein